MKTNLYQYCFELMIRHKITKTYLYVMKLSHLLPRYLCLRYLVNDFQYTLRQIILLETGFLISLYTYETFMIINLYTETLNL